MRRLTVSFATLALTSAALAAAAPTFDPKHLSEDDKVLSSDAFEGRGPATPAETKTVDYVVGQMKAAGLSPGGGAQASSCCRRASLRSDMRLATRGRISTASTMMMSASDIGRCRNTIGLPSPIDSALRS